MLFAKGEKMVIPGDSPMKGNQLDPERQVSLYMWNLGREKNGCKKVLRSSAAAAENVAFKPLELFSLRS